MTYQTLRQKSELLRAAERGLEPIPAPSRGDYIVGAVGVIGSIVLLVMGWAGFA